MSVVGSDGRTVKVCGPSGSAPGAAASLPAAPVEPGLTTSPAPWSCPCGRRWGSLVQAHCAVCHRQFSGISTFDMHRSGGRCRDPLRMWTTRDRLPVLTLSGEIHGPVWRGVGERPDPEISGPQISTPRESQ